MSVTSGFCELPVYTAGEGKRLKTADLTVMTMYVMMFSLQPGQDEEAAIKLATLNKKETFLEDPTYDYLGVKISNHEDPARAPDYQAYSRFSDGYFEGLCGFVDIGTYSVRAAYLLEYKGDDWGKELVANVGRPLEIPTPVVDDQRVPVLV